MIFRKMKSLVGITSLSVVSAGLVSGIVVFSATQRRVGQDVLTIQAEAAWVPKTEEIIRNFKKNNAQLLTENGVEDIQVMEKPSFDMVDSVITKGYRDPGISDIYIAQGDKLPSLIGSGSLKPFTQATPNEFLQEMWNDSQATFTEASLQSVKPGDIKTGLDPGMYAVPEAYEAMIPYRVEPKPDDDHTIEYTVTEFSDLWKAGGFFNTKNGDDIFNFKDIVGYKFNEQQVTNCAESDTPESDGCANTTANPAAWTTFLNNGFKNMMTAAGPNFGSNQNIVGGQGTAKELLNTDSNTSGKYIRETFARYSNNTSIIAGAWAEEQIVEAIKNNNEEFKENKNVNPVAGEIAEGVDYLQWNGGWAYVLNKRINDQKQTVAEALIGEILKTENVSDIYKVWGKISPTTAGEAYLRENTADESKKEIINAVYDQETVLRPTEDWFNIMWDAWAQSIALKAEDFVKGAQNPDQRDAIAQTLTESLMTFINTAIKTQNA